MKIFVYNYDTEDYGFGTMFVDAVGRVLGVVHENDGNWRHEYFNPIFKEAGITIVNKRCFTEDDHEIYSKLKNYFGD